jgi:hypothetical protein
VQSFELIETVDLGSPQKIPVITAQLDRDPVAVNLANLYGGDGGRCDPSE